MKWTHEQLGFILYNNRSVEGVVENFLPKNINPVKLIYLENALEKCKDELYTESLVGVEMSKLNLDTNDIIVTPTDLEKLGDLVLNSHNSLGGWELEYLYKRGIKEDIINKWKLGGLSHITDYNHLIILNATCHPILSSVLVDGIDGGGIIIPLYNEEGKLKNCAIRKISDVGKLKYSLACPDIGVWGIDDVEDGDEIWICEGLFDMMALISKGKKAVSVSSAMWSGLQLYELLQKRPRFINIVCDNDRTGIRVGKILSDFFTTLRIKNKTLYCPLYKDAAEIIFERGLDVDMLEVCEIDNSMIESRQDNFNFLTYLQNRNF